MCEACVVGLPPCALVIRHREDVLLVATLLSAWDPE